jgi:putative tricarboxylic transport membrane protein
MDIFGNIGLGLEQALTASNLLYCFIGVLLGTLIGVLPGLGPVATLAMLLPFTFGIDPTGGLIMLAGIYYGAQYGGSTTAILLNIPGEPGSVVTALDGHQLARRGKAGFALVAAAVGSFFAGTVATFLIAWFAPALASVALMFGSAEYFALILLGLVTAIALAHGSLLKATAMIILGLLLSTVGQDDSTGQVRFGFGFSELASGLSFTALAMGLFGIGDIVRNLEDTTRSMPLSGPGRLRELLPSASEWRLLPKPILRGTLIGSAFGLLPGGGAVLGSFASYSLEKQISRHPEQFGKGAIEGVAGPEAANNAGAQTSFIPMLTLGLPANPVMALMIGAMIIQGIQPGPNIVNSMPELFWGVVVSMWIGNLMLLVLNLPLVGLWVKLMEIPYRLMFPAIVAICCIGAFSVSNSVADVYTMAGFGLLGYLLVKLGCEPAPLLLGYVIGGLLEEHLRRALLLSRGDPGVFIASPIAAMLLAIAFGALLLTLVPKLRQRRDRILGD